MRKPLNAFAALFVLFGVIAGCSTDHKTQRSLITVDQVNAGAPVISDVYDQGDTLYSAPGVFYTEDDPGVLPDLILFVFSNKPANSIVSPQEGKTYGDYIIERYEIVWRRSDGGPVPPPWADQMSLRVPSGDDAAAFIRLVSYTTKSHPILQALLTYHNSPGANPGQIITMHADITFYGREADSDKETSFKTAVSIEFLDHTGTVAD